MNYTSRWGGGCSRARTSKPAGAVSVRDRRVGRRGPHAAPARPGRREKRTRRGPRGEARPRRPATAATPAMPRAAGRALTPGPGTRRRPAPTTGDWAAGTAAPGRARRRRPTGPIAAAAGRAAAAIRCWGTPPRCSTASIARSAGLARSIAIVRTPIGPRSPRSALGVGGDGGQRGPHDVAGERAHEEPVARSGGPSRGRRARCGPRRRPPCGACRRGTGTGCRDPSPARLVEGREPFRGHRGHVVPLDGGLPKPADGTDGDLVLGDLAEGQPADDWWSPRSGIRVGGSGATSRPRRRLTRAGRARTAVAASISGVCTRPRSSAHRARQVVGTSASTTVCSTMIRSKRAGTGRRAAPAPRRASWWSWSCVPPGTRWARWRGESRPHRVRGNRHRGRRVDTGPGWLRR